MNMFNLSWVYETGILVLGVLKPENLQLEAIYMKNSWKIQDKLEKLI